MMLGGGHRSGTVVEEGRGLEIFEGTLEVMMTDLF
jgi:hypothetical protein